MPTTPLSPDTLQPLQKWCCLWRVGDLAPEIRVEISSRMSRSLGRCYPDRKLIRIAKFVAEGSDELFQEVLCHEAAHVAAYHLHGKSIRPHGREWKALVQEAGYAPSVRFKGDSLTKLPVRTPRKTFLDTLVEGLQGVLLRRVNSPAYRKRRP